MTYRIGIDAGSKTLKVLVLDEDGNDVYSTYMRHRANIARTLNEAIHDLNWRIGDFEATIAITGSAAIEVARLLGIPFVQEVAATTYAVRKLVPQADVAIELGGEDAKIIYLTDGLEQRMNATCAGGTGGFIDTIAYMLDVKSSEMSSLAFGANRTYPIASRCAVFAQTDVRPLLNAGASKADIAASTFDAVVRQTLGGLSCGRPIRGNVVFLGGPLEHMPYLVQSFAKALELTPQQKIKPKDAHLFTVRGTAMLSADAGALGCAPVTMTTGELLERIGQMGELEGDLERLPALFESEDELEAFRERHAQASFPRKSIYHTEGPLFLGIDAGSTTLKIVALDQEGNIVHTAYEPIKGDVIKTLKDMLESLYLKVDPPAYLPHAKPKMWIARACATGYGEELLRAAFGVDMGVVETAAHLRAATELCPDVSFVLDIGGQDMKALWVRHGMVVDAALNEACSSGCGAFIEGTAAALKSTPWQFAEDALQAKSPIDLGTKCTVFMNSRVKHAQKTGAGIDDIAAGVAYSVIKNALHRIIGDDRMPTADDRVVVQGGTFKSDAVLRAFEQLTGIEAIRPEQTHLMGAIGCALFARDTGCEICPGKNSHSSLIPAAELADLAPKRMKLECTGCPNGCALSVVTFDEEGSRYFISDNKCDKGLQELERRREIGKPSEGMSSSRGLRERAVKTAQAGCRGATIEARGCAEPPNLIEREQQLLASFGGLEQEGPRGRVRVGLLDSMEMYAAKPFWHTLLAKLGFSIVVPKAGCEGDLASEAWETVPSESVCFPAKTTHLRYFSLCDKGADAVFMINFDRGNHCAVQSNYAKVLLQNASSTRRNEELAPIVTPQLVNYKPRVIVSDAASRETLRAALNAILREAGEGDGIPEITPEELHLTLLAALDAYERTIATLERETVRALQWLEEDPCRHGIVLAGRPYHTDEALMHGIDRELTRLGFAVFGAAGLSTIARGYRGNQYKGKYPWKPAKRLARLAHFTAEHPQLDAVFLESFGCGYEAVSLEEAKDVLDAASKPCTVLKVDDISDVAHIRIRLRTLAAAIDMRKHANRPVPSSKADTPPEQATGHRPDRPWRASLLDDIMTRPLELEDLEIERRDCVKDVCFTADIMAARVIRMLRENPDLKLIELPYVCENCLTEAIPRMVERATGLSPDYVWVPWQTNQRGRRSLVETNQGGQSSSAEKQEPDPIRIGLVGNPLIVFEPFMNDHIVEKLEGLGCEVVMPDPSLLPIEDVRYIEQLKAFEEQGVTDVIYLLSFGCLKGHVSARGALRELKQRFPNLHITVIDYDPEASALNRENRLRLAVESARIRNGESCS